ncbi:MAG: alpha/beta hydrolase [Firmicutes bacterium]|nr:alpha/beta hydrolase [Candidatus Colimorpha enterica]
MIFDNIKLNVRTSGAGNYEPYLKCYIPEGSKELPRINDMPAVIICPGGGYAFRSFREDEPVALQYAADGIAAFVLEYSCDDGCGAKFPQALCEAAEAVALVRENAEKWLIDPNKIFVCGFSAGGHLAASIGTMFDSKEVRENLGGDTANYRPDGMILGYPVISRMVPTHGGSFNHLLQDLETPEMQEYLSLENRVTKDTAPAFIWATSNDPAVPVINSLVFAEALSKNGVPFELNIFKDGPHGLSICTNYTAYYDAQCKPDYQHWVRDSINWIRTF